MELNIRTWNLNFWKQRFGYKAKSPEEIKDWINDCKNILWNNKGIDFYLLQEASFKLYGNNSCYAKAPLSPVLKADSNSIALFSDAM
jgi:hypothetical protein